MPCGAFILAIPHILVATIPTNVIRDKSSALDTARRCSATAGRQEGLVHAGHCPLTKPVSL